jgi:hypothetical protein
MLFPLRGRCRIPPSPLEQGRVLVDAVFYSTEDPIQGMLLECPYLPEHKRVQRGAFFYFSSLNLDVKKRTIFVDDYATIV